MWIKYIKLNNFQNIKTGLKLNTLAIDFSNRENVLCLLVGPNGIGKTSLLSCLTPFATLGNLDVRDSNHLIIQGEDGYKNIIIMDRDDEYNIEHFYSAKKDTHSVKSYIKKNGKELNPNGNVTSFKDIVYELLGIDMDYLKLIRIGDNVTNLIKMKGTERKTFMSKYLSSVEVYLKINKKISDDVRTIKSIISHDTDKIQKLKIEDEDNFKKDIDDLKKALVMYSNELEKQKEIIHTNKALIAEELPINELKEKLNESKKKLTKMTKSLNDNKDAKLNDVINNQTKLQSKYSVLIGETEVLKQNRISIIDKKDECLSNLSQSKKNLSLELSECNIDALKDHLDELHEKRKEVEKSTDVFNCKLNKKDIEDFIVVLKNIQHMLNTTYEFGKDPIKVAIKFINNGNDIKNYIDSELIRIEGNNHKQERTYLDKIIDKYSNIRVPDCVDCELINLYNDIMKIRDLKPSNETKERTPEFYQFVSSSYDNIKYCLNLLHDKKDIIKDLPDSIKVFFDTNNLYKNIMNCDMIYKDKLVNELLLKATEEDYYNSILKEIEETQKEYAIAKSTSKISLYEYQINDYKNQVTKLNDELESINNQLDDNEITIREMSERIEVNTLLIDSLTKYEDEVNEFKSLSLSKEKIDKLSDEINKATAIELDITKKINAIQYGIQNRELSLKQYQLIMKELNKSKKIYDDLLAIKASSSSKEGVPLVYIQLYLQDVKELANELLDIAYDGDIYLKDFDISADSFAIPFIKNGIEVPDILCASQGEQGILNMAISFAISAKNLSKYNIALIDEIDSTFDAKKRELCIPIIERQNEIVQCQQMFIISHNNMFDQYPVDVLNLGDLKHSKFNIETE